MLFLKYLQKFCDGLDVLKADSLSGQRHGSSDTILRDFDPEDLAALVAKAESVVFAHRKEPKVFRFLWVDCFKGPLEKFPKRMGRIPIKVNEAQLELLALMGSVLGATYLTEQIERDSVRHLVLGIFHDEMGRHSRSTLYGLPFDGDAQLVFYRKAVRVMLAQFGRLETLAPVFTRSLPSELDPDPVTYLDGLLGSQPRQASFDSIAENLACRLIETTWQCGQMHRIRERTDEDYLPFLFE